MICASLLAALEFVHALIIYTVKTLFMGVPGHFSALSPPPEYC